MVDTSNILQSIHASVSGLTLAELLGRNPAITRRTAQRAIRQLLDSGNIHATGQGRARRYTAATATFPEGPAPTRGQGFANGIPVSADSHDILAYIDQPLHQRRPVGYQRAFLDSYPPNNTCYLPDSLRRQLHSIGAMPDADGPAGTYSRAIRDRLPIDLSWASSHLEGNTYSRPDTRGLIEHGKVARGKAATETQMTPCSCNPTGTPWM
jgi:hypothetical protein